MEPATSSMPVQRTVRYLRDVQTEMRKVVWPTRQQLIAYTISLLATVIFGSLFLYLCDVLFHLGLGLVIH